MHHKKIAIYPGTFDPITLGHIDIIERASKLFDEVIVTIAINLTKEPLFDNEERMDMIQQAIKNFPNVQVAAFDGLVVDFAHKNKATVIIRGLRAISDFEYEFQMALMNRHLDDSITTVFLMPHEAFTYLNSTIIKNVASFGGDIKKFVTEYVENKLLDKLNLKDR
ncbi:MAG: pantetheine-phosphate adenylyltransferase [Calditrichaceae bacterium]|nr:pantetheine-phosphate adenylyltransferase [Calditrichaceae bacterium]MBN2710428.1 pantetheine-phosphate adenylyltransferase [Calditrichaceae bacterium]RQV93634.1 MAG: pantetheine-phosphate adenylyltransferase [Calditrichota bacterium]